MDWVDTFVAYTSEIRSTPEFRLWAAISAVGAISERRTWVENSSGISFSNMNIMLVGTPGTGKTQAVNKITHILRQAEVTTIAPSDVSRASLVDAMAEGHRHEEVLKKYTIPEHHAIYIAVDEIGILLSKHDTEMLSLLNTFWDPGAVFEHKRRSQNQGKTIRLVGPTISVLGGVQPVLMNSLFPEEAWAGGMTSRTIFILGTKTFKPTSAFLPLADTKEIESKLIELTKKLAEVRGVFTWSQAAMELFDEKRDFNFEPIPTHPRLDHYIPRREFLITKLTTIACLSRSQSTYIEVEDIERAINWLHTAETTMPEIFTLMSGKSDDNLIREFHRHLMDMYSFNTKKVQLGLLTDYRIPDKDVFRFLQTKVPTERTNHIMAAAIQGGYAKRDEIIVDGEKVGMWKPLVP